MMRLREQPLRLEAILTRDYINRAQKMRDIEQSVQRHRAREPWLVGAGWLVVVGLLAYVLMNY